MIRSALTSACPCGALDAAKRVLTYAQCCGRFVENTDQAAPDAERLMRSRYTAFVLQREDYLQATWHASTRPTALDFEAGAHWLGLEVRRHVPELNAARVEFVARYRVGGKAVRLHETSRFVHEAGRWFYVDGDQRP